MVPAAFLLHFVVEQEVKAQLEEWVEEAQVWRLGEPALRAEESRPVLPAVYAEDVQILQPER